jgi:hypothetical protein
MRRSVGVTISAVVVLLGSGFTVLCGAFLVMVSSVLEKSNQIPNLPGKLHNILYVEAAAFCAFGVWGIATAAGLFRLAQWARISI